MYHDPQLRTGGYLSRHQTSDGVWRDLPGLPWRFEGLDPVYITAAPVLGQHNTLVYRDLLGLSDAEIAHLIEEQSIY